MTETDVLSLLFGKKRRRRTRRKTTTRKRKTKKIVKKKIGFCMKRTKTGTRCVKVYKITGKPGKRYYNGRKCSKRMYTRKAACMAAYRKKMKAKKGSTKTKRRTVRRRRRRRSSFGVGGSYMPLGSIMSPYPSSVDSSPPWI